MLHPVLTPDLELDVIDLLRIAGSKIILPRFRNLSDNDVSEKASSYDLVTVADEMTESFLTRELMQIFPDAKIIGEESACENPDLLKDIDTHDISIVIDPIDGTWNYAHGIATFGMILSILHKGVPVFGVHYDPINDDWVVAQRGQGAKYQKPGCDPQKLSVRANQGGFIALSVVSPDKVGRTIEAAHQLGPIKSLHCSCHEYRILAQGGISYCLSKKSMPWDHAAGALIHQEAGGVTMFLDGEPYRPSRYEGPILNASSKAEAQMLQTKFGGIFS